jgi:hypothetical protein
MRSIVKRVGTLEARGRDTTPILIAVSPNETNEEALADSGKDKASLEGRTIYYIHTGVPRPDEPRRVAKGIARLPELLAKDKTE